ncbi:MAG: DUF3192 domain-containing protein [Myxococcota bacterium]|nr:DUF3192 domain-containing protein [Myxococcota bacterium]
MRAILQVLLVATVSCVSPTTASERLVRRNQAALGELAPGMARSEVEATMESALYFLREGGNRKRLRVPNPYRESTLEQGNGSPAELLFYYTERVGNDGVVTEDELTPLALEGGRLVGWGWPFVEARYGQAALAQASVASLQDEIDGERTSRRGGGMGDPYAQERREAIGRANGLIILRQLGGF